MSKQIAILVSKISAITVNSNDTNLYSFAEYIPAGSKRFLLGTTKRDMWKIYDLFPRDSKYFYNSEDAISYIETHKEDHVRLGEDNKIYYQPSVCIYYSLGGYKQVYCTYYSTMEEAKEAYDDIIEQIRIGSKTISFSV
jgi:hypothetical protein